MSMSMHLAPILRKAAQMQNEQNMQAMADKLAESKRDRVRVNMSGIERGVTFTLEIQDGILELIGLAAQQMGGMMGGPGADF
jgi:ribosomal protein L18E